QRYLGEEEPLYKKAGHIPGAKNFYWKDVFHDDGKWKDIAQLEKHLASFRKDDKIIVSCGSGISACTNIVALKRSGFRNVMLYPGSYSDWISYDENEIETRGEDRKSTRLNSSHVSISYAVFCLKKKKK